MFQFEDNEPLEIDIKVKKGKELADYFEKLKLDNSHIKKLVYNSPNGSNYFLIIIRFVNI